jgi:hypothetical protein
MAILDSSKVDLLWKKVVFGVSKTDSATAKSGSNETISSALPVYGYQIWSQADLIPAIPPIVSTFIVQKVDGITNSALTTADPTSALNATWISLHKDWIPPTFNSGYSVKVYIGNPATTGTQIFPDTNGYEFIFDYSAGVLNFLNGIPANVGANGIYILGYKYVGKKGVGGANSSKNFVVNDIAERDAIAGIATGDTVYVKDASGIATDAGPGEYATYMYIDNAYKLISSQDSAESDAKTTQVTITASSTGTIPFSRVGNRTRIISCSVEVITAFDGTLDLSIGDVSSNNSIMSTLDHDVKSIGAYMVTPTAIMNMTAETQLNIYVTGMATVGSAKVTITYA